jgi:hypothetical protein
MTLAGLSSTRSELWNFPYALELAKAIRRRGPALVVARFHPMFT